MMLRTNDEYLKYQSNLTVFTRGVKVYLGGLDPNWSEQDIHRFMRCFGTILKVTISKDERQFPKGYGFVVFSNAAEAASSFGPVHYQNRVVVVKPSHKHNYHGYDTHQSTMEYADNYNRQTLECSGEGSRLSNSPKADTRKSTALSKHSKNFDTFTSLASPKSGEYSGVDVKVIQLGMDHGQAASKSLLSNSFVRTQKPVEKAAHISRFSKEFYPRSFQISSISTVELESGVGKPAAVISDYSHHEGNILSGHPNADIGFADLAAIRNRSVDSDLPFVADSSVFIRFYTFPGRD